MMSLVQLPPVPTPEPSLFDFMRVQYLILVIMAIVTFMILVTLKPKLGRWFPLVCSMSLVFGASVVAFFVVVY